MPARMLLALAVAVGSMAAAPAGAKPRDPVERALPSTAAAERALYRQAKRARRHLRGQARGDLDGVLRATRSLARRGRLEAVRAQAFLTVRRNLEWYRHDRQAPSPAGTRTTFAGSPVIFQRFAGAGWQVHPLANFGRLNALVRTRDLDAARRLADDLVGLLAPRGRALAPEYLFPYAGGPAGWVSGMAAATGMQALSRLSERTGDQRYVTAAGRMLPLFEMRPPAGIRRRVAPGRAHYLLYSQAPTLFVGNGFMQALIGLSDYATLSGDPRAVPLLDEGLRQARAGLRHYDTGAWSRYARAGAESTLHYHRLFATFLRRLCRAAGERRFCTQARRFRAYESEPITIGRIRTRAYRRVIAIRFRPSKTGTALIALRRGERLLDATRVRLSGQDTRVVLERPRRGGRFSVTIEASSLTGVPSKHGVEVRIRRAE